MNLCRCTAYTVALSRGLTVTLEGSPREEAILRGELHPFWLSCTVFLVRPTGSSHSH